MKDNLRGRSHFGRAPLRKARTPRPKAGAPTMTEPSGRVVRALGQPVDVASLAFFRIAFGVIMVWEVCRYFALHRIRRYYLEPQFFFSYFGFDWVKPWPGDGMYFHFAALGVLGGLVAFGLFYRLSAALFFVGFTYVFLIDQSLYLNHLYLVSLISFLMIFIPAHRAWSLDARWGITRRAGSVPSLPLWLLRAQVGIVYFFGGIAKLNGDWLRGEPLREWLALRGDLPIVGPVLNETWTVWFVAYGGLFFDLLITPALLWRRTRRWAFGIAVGFHLINSVIFQIGIFPWFMIVATTLFLSPDWPRRWLIRRQPQKLPTREMEPRTELQPTVVALAAIYLIFQLLMPLRHWLYPGNVNWTEEGHRFSWRMKLRDKSAEAQFYVTDPASGQTQLADPGQYLNVNQRSEMVTRPDMILQFAHHLAAEARRNGLGTNMEVRAFVRASLNGRASHLLIDPSVNLAAEPRTLGPARWIRPLGEPLRRPQ
jgi:vitamin K-dependent gamma-carboxylase